MKLCLTSKFCWLVKDEHFMVKPVFGVDIMWVYWTSRSFIKIDNKESRKIFVSIVSAGTINFIVDILFRSLNTLICWKLIIIPRRGFRFTTLHNFFLIILDPKTLPLVGVWRHPRWLYCSCCYLRVQQVIRKYVKKKI